MRSLYHLRVILELYDFNVNEPGNERCTPEKYEGHDPCGVWDLPELDFMLSVLLDIDVFNLSFYKA